MKNLFNKATKYVTEPEFLDIWRKYLKVQEKLELVTPVYKKVRHYAFEWKPTSFAPNFYDVIEVFSHNERSDRYWDIEKAKVDKNAYIELTVTLKLDSHYKAVFPERLVSPLSPSSITKYDIESIKYEFPLIKSINKIPRGTYFSGYFEKICKDIVYTSVRQAEKIVRSETKVNGVKIFDFGGTLPTKTYENYKN